MMDATKAAAKAEAEAKALDEAWMRLTEAKDALEALQAARPGLVGGTDIARWDSLFVDLSRAILDNVEVIAAPFRRAQPSAQPTETPAPALEETPWKTTGVVARIDAFELRVSSNSGSGDDAYAWNVWWNGGNCAGGMAPTIEAAKRKAIAVLSGIRAGEAAGDSK
jgi:hypothetical protein